jgi:hypothetical protein
MPAAPAPDVALDCGEGFEKFGWYGLDLVDRGDPFGGASIRRGHASIDEG